MKIILDINTDAVARVILYLFIIFILVKMIIGFTESKFINKSIEIAKKFILPPKDDNPTKLNYLSWFMLLPLFWFVFLFAIVYFSNK